MINSQQIRDYMSISYFKADGTLGILDIKLDDKDKYNWELTTEDDRHKDPVYVSQEGKPVRRIRKQYINKYRRMEFINSLPEAIQSKIFADVEPQKYFWDIECETFNEFPDENNPIGRIQTHQYCDTRGNGYVLGIKPLTADQIHMIEVKVNEYLNSIHDHTLHKDYKFHYLYYPDEITMNKDFITNHITKMPCIFGWNVLKFDARYTVNRCKKIGLDPSVMSPKRQMFTHTIKDKYNENINHIIELPLHRPIIDYMSTFEAFDKSVKFKTSMSLDYISEEVLGVKKITHSESLMELYEKDYPRFVLYGIIDTFLVQLIDQKCNTFSMMENLANIGKVDLLNAPYASVIVENLLSDYYYQEYKKVFVRDYNKVVDQGSYSGGFVLEPNVGLRAGIGIYDYASLFPSIMQFLNIGEDTYVGQTKDRGKTVILPNGETVPFDRALHIWTENGCVYSKTVEGTTRHVLSRLFAKRLAAKLKDSELKGQITELKRMLKNYG